MSPHAGAPLIAHGFSQYHIPIPKTEMLVVSHEYLYSILPTNVFKIK